MKNNRFYKIVVAVIMIFFLSGSLASAQYPDKNITLIVPFGAGGTTDINCRLFAAMLEKKLGVSIAVKNVGGAGGTIGAAEVSAAKADGYTFGFLPVGPATMQPHIKKVPYNIDSWTFVANVNNVPAVLMVKKSSPWTNFQEMLDDVKAHPKKYYYATSGTGNITHLTMLAVLKDFGLEVNRIPHRSSAEIMKEIAGNRIHFYSDTPSALSKFDVKALAVYSTERFPLLKDVPTTKEFGHEIIYSVWQGVFAPKGVDIAKINIIGEKINEVVSSPEYLEAMRKVSTEPQYMDSKEFEKFARAENDKYMKVLKTSK